MRELWTSAKIEKYRETPYKSNNNNNQYEYKTCKHVNNIALTDIGATTSKVLPPLSENDLSLHEKTEKDTGQQDQDRRTPGLFKAGTLLQSKHWFDICRIFVAFSFYQLQ